MFLVGAFLNAWLFSRAVDLGEGLLGRIPVVKTVYTGLRDLFTFLSRERGDSSLQRVVSVELQPEVHVIGFVTDDDAARSVPALARDASDPIVSVYLPMGLGPVNTPRDHRGGACVLQGKARRASVARPT